ncbi:hypothetical protein DSM106972_003730 [Dulcicalothrix desertica PCC 7102]|uniref:NACHT domain-containing protein n=2 Tax=Dulcicalothrix desertica TaxID=32056 RepID=A0A433VUV1_9CYAN|nr:hypothetical protein DSM106972_003730 [Dulcicalothrix desertica PCC 7102]
MICAGIMTPSLGANSLVSAGIGVISNIFSNELPKYLEEVLRHSSEILQHRDLTEVVGLAIAVVIDSVAKEFSQYSLELHKISWNTGKNWWLWTTESGDDIPIPPIRENQLILIFSKKTEEFEKVRLLEQKDWQDIFNWLCVLNNVEIPEELRKHVAEKLYTTFPRAVREVLKDDAGRGGQAYKEMQLLLMSKIIDATQDLQKNDSYILERLGKTASKKDVQDALALILEALNRSVTSQSFYEHIIKIETKLDGLAVLLKQNQPFYPDFEDYINEKIQDFVGRQFVFNEIKNFLLNQKKGYFLIEADPGFGKSAIIAKLIRLAKCIGYFNIIRQNRVTTEQFIESVCQQLISRYQLTNYSTPIHPDNLRDGTFFSKLLQEASKKLGIQEKLIIAIDALDEVDISNYRSGVNVLYLPESLPNGVYIILTKRPQKLPLVVNNVKNFNLRGYESNCRQDVESYIKLRINQKQALQNWIQSQQVTNANFVTILADKSENNFMYLHYILPEIESNSYQSLNINNLPQGLQSYYYQHWQRMGMISQPLPMDKVDIVYRLAISLEPVSVRMLAQLSKKQPFIVQRVLDEWGQFLHKVKVGNESRYSIYHKSFQDFLLSDEIAGAYEDEIS